MTIFQEYSAVGNKEDLLDVISNITPAETPFVSRFKKVHVDGTKVDWQTDTLRAAASNAQVGGYTYADVMGAVSPSTLVYNYTQILSVGYEVTKTQERVAKAGRTSEVAYQKAKGVKEFALDFEYALALVNDRVVASSGVAGESRSVPTWITTHSDAQSAATLTETTLNNSLQDGWTAGAVNMNAIYCGGFQKRKISGFPSSVRQLNQDSTTYKNLVTAYESDFGMYEVVLDRRIATDDVYILDDDMWQIGILRPVTSVVALAGTRSADAFIIEGEITLICKNEAANVEMTGCATS